MISRFFGPFKETAAGEGVTLFSRGINPNLAVFQTTISLYSSFGIILHFFTLKSLGNNK
jgi:hypothetical protein